MLSDFALDPEFIQQLGLDLDVFQVGHSEPPTTTINYRLLLIDAWLSFSGGAFR
jgi:hypothetical protein